MEALLYLLENYPGKLSSCPSNSGTFSRKTQFNSNHSLWFSVGGVLQKILLDVMNNSNGQRDYKNWPFYSKFKDKVFCYYSYVLHNQSSKISFDQYNACDWNIHLMHACVCIHTHH